MSLINHIKRIHFVGIGGVGMCGIAEVLHHSGFSISGSDCIESPTTKRLQNLGIQISIGHGSNPLENIDALVRSTAIKDDNPEVIIAKQLNIPIVARAEMLAEILRNKQGIAVSGTHGKTTTTSLLSHLLMQAKVDPTFIIGGKLNHEGLHAQLGKSEYVVVEADESDASFLFLNPILAILTNIDEDHMATYNNDFNCLRQTFMDFLEKIPFYGTIAACIDDSNVRDLLKDIHKPITTYGFHCDADIQAINWQQVGLNSQFILRRKNKSDINISLNLPGKHNVQNALAAIAIAEKIGVSDIIMQQALESFGGVARRFHMLGNINFNEKKSILIDDYGHHPKEIDSTIEAIRKVWPEKRLVHVFQPHRYSRTKDLFNDFSLTLSKSDCIILPEIFSAGETPINGISSEHLAQHIRKHAPSKHVQALSLNTLTKTLATLVEDGDIVLMQGAGSITHTAHALANDQAAPCN